MAQSRDEKKGRRLRCGRKRVRLRGKDSLEESFRAHSKLRGEEGTRQRGGGRIDEKRERPFPEVSQRGKERNHIGSRRECSREGEKSCESSLWGIPSAWDSKGRKEGRRKPHKELEGGRTRVFAKRGVRLRSLCNLCLKLEKKKGGGGGGTLRRGERVCSSKNGEKEGKANLLSFGKKELKTL